MPPANQGIGRRQWLLTTLLTPLNSAWAQPSSEIYAPELVKRTLQFPQDLGSHPNTAIEWWYVTGELQAKDRLFGFQLTFFRSRVPGTQAMRSAFAAKQLFFAHAAVTDVRAKRLLHDQRVARSSGLEAVDLASASNTDTDVQLRDWSLLHRGEHYLARAQGKDFAFELTLDETQPLLLQGDKGLSRKGPQATQASYYYSLPQLRVVGQLALAGGTVPVTGRAWLDHEWSQSLMHPDAVGWDWIGMNLINGAALTAFRLRDKTGGTLWTGGSWRERDSTKPVIFFPDQVVFTPQRIWQSPASQTHYPVQWALDIHHPALGAEANAQHFTVHAVIDDQELDSRLSTGAIYWEGLSELRDAQGHMLGRGYLEMTGYASPLRL
jgi:predicted secreted hydrolase